MDSKLSMDKFPTCTPSLRNLWLNAGVLLAHIFTSLCFVWFCCLVFISVNEGWRSVHVPVGWAFFLLFPTLLSGSASCLYLMLYCPLWYQLTQKKNTAPFIDFVRSCSSFPRTVFLHSLIIFLKLLWLHKQLEEEVGNLLFLYFCHTIRIKTQYLCNYINKLC